MTKPLNVLIIEDYQNDVLLLIEELRTAGYEPFYKQVETFEQMQEALAQKPWDIILSDYSMPRFSATAALKTLKESGLDIPFIIISGTVGEETAVECMRAGASDFMVKGQLHRLIPAIEREIREAGSRKSKQRVECELLESEDRFRNMADAASIMIWTMDVQGQLTYINRRFSEVIGVPAHQVLQLDWKQIHHPEELHAFIDIVEQSLRLKEGFSVEHRSKDKNGRYLWIFTTTAPRFSSRGEFLGLIGSSVDITDRKEAEEELHSRSRQQEIVTELGLAALTGVDLNELINKSLSLIAENLQVEFCKYLELLPDENVLLLKAGIGWEEGLVGKARIPVIPDTHVGYTLLSREPVVFENLATEIRFKGSGLLQDHQITSGLSVVLYVQNKPYGILSIHTRHWRRFTSGEQNFMQAVANVLSATIERQVTENALSESEARFRMVADTAPVIIWMSNEKAETIFVNKAMDELSGLHFQFGDIVHWPSITHPDDLQRVKEIYMRAFEKREPWELEQRVRRHDGEYRWLLSTGVPRYSGEGDFLGYIGSAVDITERKKAEEELLNYAKRLIQSNKELEDFATIASHDLQAPLRKVITFSDLLRINTEGKLSDECLDYIGRIQKSSTRMQELITDLLALSRITRKANPFEPTDLNQALIEVLEDLELPIQEKRATIKIENLCTIDADPSQIKQVFNNLLGNSLKFSRKDIPPVITISSSTNGRNCEIRLSDNGIGFNEEFNERIFKVFERLHGNNAYPGTGIGLTIVRKIVERHRGIVTAHGKPDHGATFILSLPVKQVPV